MTGPHSDGTNVRSREGRGKKHTAAVEVNMKSSGTEPNALFVFFIVVRKPIKLGRLVYLKDIRVLVIILQFKIM